MAVLFKPMTTRSQKRGNGIQMYSNACCPSKTEMEDTNQQVKQTVTSDSAMASPKVTDTKDSNELELELSEEGKSADVLEPTKVGKNAALGPSTESKFAKALKPLPDLFDDASVDNKLSPALITLLKKHYLSHIGPKLLEQRLLTKMHVATLTMEDILTFNLVLGDRNQLYAASKKLREEEMDDECPSSAQSLRRRRMSPSPSTTSYSGTVSDACTEISIADSVFAEPITKTTKIDQQGKSIADFYYLVGQDHLITFPNRSHYVCLVCDGESKSPKPRLVRTHSEVRKHAKQVGHREMLQQLRAKVGEKKEKPADQGNGKRKQVQTTITSTAASLESPLKVAKVARKGDKESEARKVRLAALQSELQKLKEQEEESRDM